MDLFGANEKQDIQSKNDKIFLIYSKQSVFNYEFQRKSYQQGLYIYIYIYIYIRNFYHLFRLFLANSGINDIIG